MGNKKTIKHPVQPLVWDGGVVRFKKNAIVRFLLDYATSHGYSLNEIVQQLHEGGYSKDDYTQLMQLIGYSTGGFGELSRVDRKIVVWADTETERMVKLAKPPARAGKGGRKQ